MRVFTASRGGNKINRVFRKNLILVTSFVVILTVISTAIYLISYASAKNNRINLLESEEMEKSKTALSHMLDEVANTCLYFSTLTFNLNLDNQNYDYNQVTQTQRQMNVVLATFNAVDNITITDPQNGYTIKSHTAPRAIENSDMELLGTVKGALLYFNRALPGSELYMIKSVEPGAYGSNQVAIGIDARSLSDTVLFSKNDEMRNEFLVDKAGNIIFSNRTTLFGKNLQEGFGIAFDPEQTGSRQLKRDGREYLLSIKPAAGLDAYLVTVVDLQLYDSIIVESNLATVLLILALLLSSVIIIYFIFTKTYKPIKDIMSQLGEISIVTPEGDDEIQYIKRNLQKYSASNSELAEAVEEKANELRLQHVSALQSQICPHFTYNTLDAINWIAYRNFKDRNNEISRAVSGMSRIFYSCMDLSGFFRPIREEIDLTKTYIEILKIRIKNAFEVTFDVDPALEEENILKMCIQPLVENISLHALSDEKEQVHIFIGVRSEGANVIVTVQDDGVGISQDKLNHLRREINDFSQLGVRHIGLKNVNERLKLIYGEASELVINSIEGEGTVCSFKYPKRI